jgi:similar to stage IV sporulation protein
MAGRMMRQTFTHMLRGYLFVELTGYTPERFFNLCRSNEIELWDISCEDGGRCHRFFADLPDYRRVRPLVRKSGVHLHIIGKHGLPFFLHRNRRRKLYIAGLASFCVVLFLMTRYIWDISFEGNYHFSEDTLMKYLAEKQIVYGMEKSRIDCNQLEEEIRSSFPEILWVSARISGTRLLIHIKENDVVSEIPVPDQEPCDLVAADDGVITRMVVRQGKAQVKAGDTIERGQLLVSGNVPVLDEYDALIREYQVHADADIYAQTEKTMQVKLPGLVAERTPTGKERHGLRIELGGDTFLWMIPFTGENSWETVVQRRQVTIFGDFYLPVWISWISAREYQVYERPIRKEELERQKEICLQKIQDAFTQKGVAIIQNDDKILGSNVTYALQAHFVVEEPVAKAQILTESKEREQPDERNRDNH